MLRRSFLLTAAVAAAQPPRIDWPSFRGPDALGISPGPAPLFFNTDTTYNRARGVRFKTKIPGLGHSSPIIWGDHVYLLTAVSASGDAPLRVGLYGDGGSANDNGAQSWKVLCIDKRNGQLVWERTAREGRPRSPRHTKATHANTTLATDGRHLIAFLGSEGLHSFSLTGKLQWSKDFGDLDAGPMPDDLSWGFASSPVLHDGVVVVQADVKKNPFLAAFSAKDGAELWKTPRQGVSERSWSTPNVISVDKKHTQVVCNGWPYIAGYDFKTGAELWRLKSAGDVPVPTPIYSNKLIFVTNAHGGSAPLYAIRPSAIGDITPKSPARSSGGVAWMEPRNGAYMQTPIVDGGILYSCTDSGIVSAFDVFTGQRFYQERIGVGGTAFTASPVAAEGRIYFTSEEGMVYVIKTGPSFQLLGVNRLGEVTLATPAISQGAMFFRTRNHLIAVDDDH